MGRGKQLLIADCRTVCHVDKISKGSHPRACHYRGDRPGSHNSSTPPSPTPIEIQLEMLTICGRKYPNGPLLLMAVKSPHWLGICAIITSVFMLIAL